MSSYRGRTGPNFSEYLSSLNSVTSPYDQATFNVEDLDLSQDLAMFTNADFTHFDLPPLPEEGAFSFDVNDKSAGNWKTEDMFAEGDASRQQYHAPQMNQALPSEPVQYYPSYNTPIQPAPAQGFSPVENQVPSNSASQQAASARPKVSSTPPSVVSPDEQSRLAAEEDKRRRNTAASARFRVKKKQREQTLEKTVKEVNDKNSKLEAKIQQLEMENKWLKDLITEKNGAQSIDEIAAAYQKYRKESEERDFSSAKEESIEMSS